MGVWGKIGGAFKSVGKEIKSSTKKATGAVAKITSNPIGWAGKQVGSGLAGIGGGAGKAISSVGTGAGAAAAAVTKPIGDLYGDTIGKTLGDFKWPIIIGGVAVLGIMLMK